MLVVEDLKKEQGPRGVTSEFLCLAHTHTHFAMLCFAIARSYYTTTCYRIVHHHRLFKCLFVSKKRKKKKLFELRGTNVLTGRAAHTTRMRNVTSMGGSRGGKTYKQTSRERRDDYTT